MDEADLSGGDDRKADDCKHRLLADVGRPRSVRPCRPGPVTVDTRDITCNDQRGLDDFNGRFVGSLDDFERRFATARQADAPGH